MLLALLLSGGRRARHLQYLAGDPLVARFCGLRQLPTARTVGRWLAAFRARHLPRSQWVNALVVARAIQATAQRRLWGPTACHHRCQNDADCTASTFCYNTADLGPVCVGCGQPPSGDNSKCTVNAVCDGNDCKQFDHPECTSTGVTCTISDRYVVD